MPKSYPTVTHHPTPQPKDDANGLRLVRHELPVLGDASVLAAKAVLAAEEQGKHTAMKQRLSRATFITDEAFIRTVAQSVGIDARRLAADMASEDIARQLATSRALADMFGFVGTPALVIGSTVTVGAVTEGTIRAVIADERALSVPQSCRTT